MNKFITAITLTLFVLVLNGCGDKKDGKDGKEDCDKKGAGWVWEAVKKECVVAPTTEEDCRSKGEGWIWDLENKQCNAPVDSAVSTTEEGMTEKDCKVKGVGWTWDEASKQCNHIEFSYMTITIPGGFGDSIYATSGTRRSGGSGYSPFYAHPGECVKIHKFDVAQLRVTMYFVRPGETGRNHPGDRGLYDLCSNRPNRLTEKQAVPPCNLGNYQPIRTDDNREPNTGGRPIVLELLPNVDVDNCNDLFPTDS